MCVNYLVATINNPNVNSNKMLKNNKKMLLSMLVPVLVVQMLPKMYIYNYKIYGNKVMI